MKSGLVLLVVAGIVLPVQAAPAVASGASGIWTMSSGKVTVRVSACGGTICGSIAGLKEPISKIDGKPKVDRENPDPALRRRPLIGLKILIGMKPAGDGKWKGAIYNPDDGKTYSSTVKLDGDTMKVQGCVIGILCKTNIFQRAD
jgi:uncharacterized protein (DUF2147 family)